MILISSMNVIDLTGHFLVGMPGLQDVNFSNSVIYVLAHGDEGTLGMAVNKPLEISFGTLLQQISARTADEKVADVPIYRGGPVGAEHGFVLHRNEQTADLVSTRENGNWVDALDEMLSVSVPGNFLIAIGYSSWAPGQLEQEMQENIWLSMPADEGVIFDIPADQRWHVAFDLLGINLSQLSSNAGHA